MKWREVKLDPKEACCYSLTQKHYKPEDSEWPIYSLIIYDWSPFEPGNYKISVSMKNSREDFWRDFSGIPKELIPELVNILKSLT